MPPVPRALLRSPLKPEREIGWLPSVVGSDEVSSRERESELGEEVNKRVMLHTIDIREREREGVSG